MKKLVLVLAIATLAPALAFGQSSGNFSAAFFPGACTINSTTGGFTGGACLTSSNSTDCKILDTPIKVSNGNGVTLLITPSAVTGLFTETKITNLLSSATAEIGIKVCVEVDGSGANVQGGDASGCAIYDERFQQLSSTLFAQVANCATATTALCNIDLIISTLSAHSYNFVAQVPGGLHTVTAEWSVVNATVNGGTVAACLGPGNITVTQTKVFNNSGSLLTF
jgi:hypothetical protein